MENPYRPSECLPVETASKPPWHERLLVGLAFAFSCLPLISLAILSLFTLLMPKAAPFASGSGDAVERWLLSLVMGLLLFSAGLALLLRRRWAAPLFAVYALALASFSAATSWQRPRIVALMLVCACFAYAMLLRLRGRLR